MNLIEEIGREALLLALFTGQTRVEQQSVGTGERDQYGQERMVQRWVTIPADSLFATVVARGLQDRYDNGKTTPSTIATELMAIAIEHIKAHPELLVPQMIKAIASRLFAEAPKDRYDDKAAKLVYSAELQGIIRDVAARILQDDQLFRERVLDMAHLSDSDSINVKIELKPKGQ